MNGETLEEFEEKVQYARYINRIACKAEKEPLGPMTPQEELYAKFFNQEAIEIQNLSLLDLRARREELRLVVIEGNARIRAIDEREKKLKPSKSEKTGFERSVNVDETTSEAINAIEKRNQRLSKKDKVLKTLLEMGVSRDEAEKMLSARNIRDNVAPAPEPKPISSQKPERVTVNFNPADCIDVAGDCVYHGRPINICKAAMEA